MGDKLDRSLDEILGETRTAPRGRRGGGGSGGSGGGGSRRRERDNFPRDGVRKVRGGGGALPDSTVMFALRRRRSRLDRLVRTSSPRLSQHSADGGFRQPYKGVDGSYSRKVVSYNRDDHRNLDSEWVHDRFENHVSGRGSAPRRPSPEPARDVGGVRVRVENIHYDLTESELEDLFSNIAPVLKFTLRYDRAGRSEGIAFVTYGTKEHALMAVKEYDGANAYGQQIHLAIVSDETRRNNNRNPFDTAVMPGRPLSERITMPDGRSRSASPTRRYEEEAARKGIDRYVPSSAARSRSRSPRNRRRGGGGTGGAGRRPGARREGGGRDSGRGGGGGGGGGSGGGGGGGGGSNSQRTGRDGRPRKTQEELDAEMADYFGGGGGGQANADPAAANGGAAPGAVDDMDMIE